MVLKNALARMLLLALIPALSGCLKMPPIPDARGAYSVSGDPSVTVPFILDDNRMYVDIAFVKPDGGLHRTRAAVNMGSSAFVLSNTLYRALSADTRAVRAQIGTMMIAMDPRVVQPEDQANTISLHLNPFRAPPTSAEIAQGPGGKMAAFAGPMNVEATIPPGLLAQFETVLDYGDKTLTLAQPGTLKPEGIPIPIRVDGTSGFFTLDVTIGEETYAAVLDNGGSYSVFRTERIAAWAKAHPGWLRSTQPIGESNYMMAAGGDIDSPVLKIPSASLGTLQLEELGVTTFMPGGLRARLARGMFWDWFSEKAGEEVNGWIGGNVLKSFRVTLDPAHRTSYWLQQAPLDTRDLDQVGLALIRTGPRVTVGGIAQKNGIATVAGVMPGDEITRIDNRPVAPMTRGELLGALHGTPGERKHLKLTRKGQEIGAEMTVTGF